MPLFTAGTCGGILKQEMMRCYTETGFPKAEQKVFIELSRFGG